MSEAFPSRVRSLLVRTPLAAVAGTAMLLVAGCADGVESPTGTRAAGPAAVTAVVRNVGAAGARPADRCVNVAVSGTAFLGGPIFLPNGTIGGGALWFPATLGGIEGEIASVLTSDEPSGASVGGARHYTLEHAFRTAAGDYFVTRDRAVCAPAGGSAASCRVNDVLTVVGGAGIFANATGSLRNQGTIDGATGTLQYSIKGRVCGDGV